MVSHRPCRFALCTLAAAVLVAALAGPAAAQDALVSVGSPTGPFSQNKQNEPAVPIDADAPQRPGGRAPTTTSTWRPATPGPTTTARSPRASASRASTSRSTPATTWTQPTYTGLSARNCLGAPGDTDPPCTPQRRADRHAARTTSRPAWSPTATRRSRSGRGRRERRVLVGQRLAPVLRQPDLGACPGATAVQGLRGDRGLAHRRRPTAAAAGDDQRLERPGHRQPAERRRCSPTRSRSGPTTPSRARSSATSTSATPRSAARQRASPTSR